MKLTKWLRLREAGIADRWMQELRLSVGRQGGGGEKLLETVVRYLVSFLPDCLGDCRERGLGVWERAAHLYGSLGLRRGLAAGEVVEELQLLRGVILRMYLLDALPNTEEPEAGNINLHMAFLTLNRVLDIGVSRASVSYVDDLFFAHLQKSGVSEGVTDEVAGELLRQLEAFRAELDC